jgi:hypothetical protein
MIRTTINVSGIAEFEKQIQRLLTESAQGKAMSMALNKVAAKGVAEINRLVPQEFNISAREVRNSISIGRASARGNNLQAVIRVFGSASKSGRSMNLVHFLERSITLAQSRKRRKAGEGGMHSLRNGGQVRKALELRFQIKRGGAKKVIKGAFLGNNGRTVFVRVGKSRLPIDALQVIGVSQMFNTKRLNDRVMAKIRMELPGEAARAVNELLRRAQAARVKI